MELHNGTWNKVSKGCWEIRGKTLGIVEYGHIGSQLSVLAESMGMSVIYYDVVNLMALGTARQVSPLPALLDARLGELSVVRVFEKSGLTIAVVDAPQVDAVRHPADLAGCRRHQLRDARVRSPDARP